MKKSSRHNVVLLFGSVRIALCLLWMSHLWACRIRHFEVARKTGSSWSSKCIVGLFWQICHNVENASHNALDNHLDPVSRATSKWRIPWVQERIIEERGRRPVSPLELMWISPKLFLDQLYAWINRKLVSVEGRKRIFSFVRRELNSRHLNIRHFLLWGGNAWT